MFAKRLIQKAIHHHPSRHNVHGFMTSADLDVRISIHYGIPTTASILAFDTIQRLLAIGTLDGRIKVVGGDNIEGLLISPKQMPYKYLEFLQNQGFLVSISNDNDIQVWNLESRCIACSLQWDSNITAFSVICGFPLMYLGDEHGSISVLKYETENGQLLQLPYHISANSLAEAAGFALPNDQPIVGVLPQPCSTGNKVLIAYEIGLIILWDVVEARIVIVRGDKVLQLKNGVIDSPSKADTSLPEDTSEPYLEEKEISALCWASTSGSILAVGYTDGDILFWRTSTAASSKHQQTGLSRNVVKLQLSSAVRRLPVIVLHWCPNKKSHSDGDGQLFIYGGDEIGSDEVLTVLSLDWSSEMETLRCVGRLDLTLRGSFADLILLPMAGERESNHNAVLFVLTNPGQLQIFDSASLSGQMFQNEKKTTISIVKFPVVIPTIDPLMTVAKLFLLPTCGNSSKLLSEIASLKKHGSTSTLSGGIKWPLTGGVPNLSSADDNRSGRVYVTGYQDGSVRIWDATDPVLSLLCVLEAEVKVIQVAGSIASVSNLNFCFLNLSLAVGDECGQVFLYNLTGSLDSTSFHFITETKHEVHSLPQGQGPCCKAVLSLFNSPVRALEFADHGTKLAVGYECGRVVVFDTSSLSILYLTDSISGPKTSVISLTWKAIMNANDHVRSPKNSGSKDPFNHAEELMFILTKDAKVYVINGGTGDIISSRPLHLKESTAISMYVIDGTATVSGSLNKKQLQSSRTDSVVKNESSQEITATGSNQHETDHQSCLENAHSGESLNDLLILLCCNYALRLYRTKSVVQGDNKSICKVKLANPCCWTTTFMKDEKICGLVVLYQTGAIEIRSLPDLGVVIETSLMSILRWNFKANMDKTMSSTDNGLISLANGCEVAFISLLASENDFRIPESLPCLHDKVLAASTDAAISFSSNQKKKQGSGPRILGGIVKGFKGGKANRTKNLAVTSTSNVSNLESIFSRIPFPEPSPTIDNQEGVELNIDDIDIDEPESVSSSSYHKVQNNERDSEKGTKKEKLFNGSTDTKPRLRTREEIMATYRKAEDASSVAGQARNKLLERQEKLERISRQTEELQSGAEDFASLANELVKAMENRKWWQI